MSIAAGIAAFVGAATETTWGTPVAASAYNRYKSQSFIDNADLTPGNENLGKIFAGGKRIYRKRSEGEITFSHRYQGLERWWWHAFGAVTTTALSGSDTGAYKHEFTLSATRKVGLSVEFHSDLKKFVLPGVKVNRASLDIGVGVPSVTFGGAGLPNVSPPGSVAGYVNNLESAALSGPGTANNGFSFQIGTAGTFGSPATVAIAEPARIDVDIPLDLNLINLGNPNMLEPKVNGLATVGGEINRYFISDAIVEYWAAGNPLYFRFQYDGPGPIITSGSQNYAMRIDVPYALISSAMPPVNAPGGLRERVPFESASPTGTAADAIAVTLWNKLASVT